MEYRWQHSYEVIFVGSQHLEVFIVGSYQEVKGRK